MFTKKRKISREEMLNEIWISSASDFAFAKETIYNRLTDNTEESLLFLKYAMKTIALDVSSSIQAAVFYMKDVDPARLSRILPRFFYTAGGEKVNLLESYDEEKLVTVDISDMVVVTAPWKINRLPPGLSKIKSETFKYDEHNHSAVFYKNMDICVIENGYHSTAAGKYFGAGRLKAQVYNTQLAYPHITTDGEYWYNGGKKIFYHNIASEPYKVIDFRFALLYEISRLVYCIETGKMKINEAKKLFK